MPCVVECASLTAIGAGGVTVTLTCAVRASAGVGEDVAEGVGAGEADRGRVRDRAGCGDVDGTALCGGGVGAQGGLFVAGDPVAGDGGVVRRVDSPRTPGAGTLSGVSRRVSRKSSTDCGGGSVMVMVTIAAVVSTVPLFAL